MEGVAVSLFVDGWSAMCDRCGWCGPARPTQDEATLDAAEHIERQRHRHPIHT